MDKSELDIKISEAAKTILSYCKARTSTPFDAEDLAQEILTQLCQSAANIRNADAFYGFMWAVAGNVYKQWCRKKAKRNECALDDAIPAGEDPAADPADLYRLRRELSLLAEKYRRAVIMYYIENKSCAQVSAELAIGESMVKYLLFKSRQILKEGVRMERNYGEQSYHPKGLSLLFWGSGPNHCYHLCDSKISQNILFACYNDKLTAEQISLEIGVALPYMEDKLAELYSHDLLKKEGKRYYTNIVIFTEDFMKEADTKTSKLKERIADVVMQTVSAQEAEIRALGFSGADMDGNSFAWQMVCFLLYQAIVEDLQSSRNITYPKDKFGAECFVWGAEDCAYSTWKSQFGFGISNVSNDSGHVQFMDFPINGEMVHHYFFNRQNNTNVFLDIARGVSYSFSENDKAIAAEMVRNGYVAATEGGLSVNVPVLTKGQHQKLKQLLTYASMQITEEAEALLDAVAQILRNHIPAHLKHLAKDMAYLHLFEDAFSAPVSLLVERGYLLPYRGGSILPTTYVVLK